MVPDPTRPLVEHVAEIRRGGVSAAETLEAVLARIEAIDSGATGLNAYREVFAEEARREAIRIDDLVAAGGDPGPLAGALIAVKDNIATRSGRTTCGSRLLEAWRSPFEATCVERIRAAGGIVLGKTNLDEFAMGSSGEHCAWGPIRNPHDPTRVPGGSSAGSAAAVAAGLCHAALGSDTGGSIRQPAAFCGCVGLKPTHGAVSRHGLVAFGSSLDQVGPLARTVEDARAVLASIVGVDRLDSTSVEREWSELGRAGLAIDGLRVGVPEAFLDGRNAPEVDDAVRRAASELEGVGAAIVPVELPLTEVGLSTYYVVAPAEASSNLARFDGIRYGRRATPRAGESLEEICARSRAEGFGPEVKRRILIGTYVLSAGYHDAYYRRALQARRLISEEYDRAFESCDVLLGPTTPTPAFELGAKADPLSMYLCDVYTVNAAIAGICGISIPAGRTGGPRPLPLAVQLQAPAWEEARLLRAARMLEGALGAASPATPLVG